ncbi:Thiosulfate sulfurtransferase, rhodanese (EC 2.8.1.1) [Methylomonas albis]|uniref:Sulfurtransferase n=1 Tax=Methylomonas albis TaxID=1854563 RepID=A0ABR9CXE8_9GAMM|nr:sulfurtransferase [Methylomonas albis]MBD9355564.1 sulfurtransferase [Methylomonas albis]CAD6878570.1 Thiosulfate sulfurtransferase, rhodanese (EC 2.8.1.1) [Methylomonas albis]
MSHTALVSARTLAANLDNPDWRIFDCRFSLADVTAGHQSYRQGHIPGARYADLNQDLSAPVQSYTGRHPLPDFRLLAEKLGAWGVTNRNQIVVYDDAGGAFAGRMWWLLRTMGHTQIAVLDGGFGHWRKQGLPVTTTLPKIAASQFRAYLDNQQWLDAAQVADGLAARKITLIDARTPERFHGRQEPIDPIAGHVPKALNRPLQSNLDKSGLFLPADQLRQQFSKLIAPYRAEQVAHMCGSGVTACHNLLAMEIAGLSGSRLYAGSWSEWISNRNRPVATD